MDPLVNADFTTKRKTSFSFLSKLVSPNHSEKKILTIKIHFTKIFSPSVPDIHNNIINNNNDNNNNIIINIKHHRL